MAKQLSESAKEKVLGYIRANRLVEGRKFLLAGVSGGPDSVCLLHLLSEIKQELGVNIHVAHLNHKLRGEESDGDAEYVAGLAEELGLQATIQHRDVNEYRSQNGGTLEEAAREVRYAFFAELAQKLNTDCVATGHTLDDNIETILLHLVRGTGTRGLIGLKPETVLKTGAGTVSVVRPLLEVTREETVAYCREHGLNPRTDSTNESLSPLRNRVRQQLVPLLESYNGGVKDALLRMSVIASDETDFLEHTVVDLWDKVVTIEGNSLFIDRTGIKELHPAVQRQLLRKAVEQTAGTLKDIETRHIAALMDGLNLQAGKELCLPESLRFIVEYDRYVLTPEPGIAASLPSLEGEYQLEVPGITKIPGWEITVTLNETKPDLTGDDPLTACFDFKKLDGGLTVRTREPADRFQPLGTDYMKKVGEYMIDAKIPRSLRDRIPLVCMQDQVIWLVGYRMDDRVKVTSGTDKVVVIEFMKL